MLPEAQIIEPVYPIPPHWPYSGTVLVAVDIALEEVFVLVEKVVLEPFVLLLSELLLLVDVGFVLLVEDELVPLPELVREKQLEPLQVRSNQERTVVAFVWMSCVTPAALVAVNEFP